MRTPRNTYRLQVRAGFDLDRATEVLDYLRDLGVDWVYLSPLLQSEPGSDHGYDVVDPSRVDAARGGAAALERLSRAAHDAGMGVLVDIVPNHMGVATPANNAWWWDVLREGRASRYADAFDIDWDAGDGQVLLPVLGDGDAEADLTVLDGELRYFDHRFPLAPGDRQHYRLVNWRLADTELNYRRFFAVNTLAGIRVEEPWVFDAAHEEIRRWIAEGLVDGLRVDHPDGLRDPAGYLARLAELTDDGYVLVEKILEPGEELETTWATAGTTGYDALAQVDRLFTDPAGEAALDRLDAELRRPDAPVTWEELIHGTKRGIADGILGSEVRRLARELGRGTDGAAIDALVELLACFPVYRSYLPGPGAQHLEDAVRAATAHRPDLAETIAELAPRLANPEEPAARRFQQTSGMVMAKGVEDTAFYRYTRLTSLTEVGADPSIFSISVDDFHAAQAGRQQTWPDAMTTLSTHDTKRGEDVRARISVLSELPELWAATLLELREAAPLGDGPLENLLWQAIVGSRPASRERLHAYAEKAAREAGDSTTWTAPDAAFEARMHALVDAAFDDEYVRRLLDTVADAITVPGWHNSLSAKLVQLTMPGVPDVYQGSELWERSLVDPDNRRPVDFDARRAALRRVREGELPPVDESGAAKLLVTHRALTLRRDRPDLFTGYRAVEARGPASGHVVAFDRGDEGGRGAITVATRLPVGLARAGGWADTTLTLPHVAHTDVLTGVEYPAGDIRLSELLGRYPVALLKGTP